MPITDAMIAAAAELAGLSFTEGERALMREALEQQQQLVELLRAVPLPNHAAPALEFQPLHHASPAPPAAQPAPTPPAQAAPGLPADLDDLAFAPVSLLSQLIHSRQISSLALTELYLGRLKQYDPQLRCVVMLTEELALSQARRADAELAAGHDRGPLHGIPWGAKDLLDTRGIATTWGAEPYRQRVPEHDAAVVQRLEAAGAVLVAKLSLGELARGDTWFGGMTRNPWDLSQGSSGSSAGSAAAVAAGLVGFAIGSETRGSIISPAARCGVSGLRPTFGRVSRAGAMALCWSMDKLGPIGRSAEDCALVLQAIYGPDGADRSVAAMPFRWPAPASLPGLRIGYLAAAFAQAASPAERQALAALRELGAQLVPIALPDLPIQALTIISKVESAAAFDELTRSDRDDLLARQTSEAWPNSFRAARLIPAVEYVQANRLRAQAARALDQLLQTVDLYVAPSLYGDDLTLTNFTGHPAVAVPAGRNEQGAWGSLTFTGRLYDEATLLAVAQAYQAATREHLQRPPLTSAGPAGPAAPATIYTIGYAGWAPQGLREHLQRLGAHVVDVRIAPTSKSPQWRREALRELFGDDYTHMPELGNRNAFSGGPALLNAPERALQPIVALLARGPVALLCGCADPHHCHRGMAASYLAERLGAPVVHIATPERVARPDDQLRLPGFDQL